MPRRQRRRRANGELGMFSIFRKKKAPTGEYSTAADAVNARDYRRAIEIYREQLRNQPKKAAQWHRKMAEVFVLDGRTKEAIASYLASAECLEAEGRLVQALALYKAVFRLDPENPEACRRLGEIAAEQGDEDEATVENDHVMTIRTRLRKYTPLFSEFDREELTRIVDVMQPHSLPGGHTIYRQGDSGDSLFVIVSGEVAFTVTGVDDECLEVDRLHDGAFFGEVSALTRAPRNLTAITVRPTEVLELSRDYLEAVAVAHPRIWQVLEDFQRSRVLPVGV